ncbi:MAG: MATE family efflux transporter, partial [Candidatus Vogelbacteria bacterium]|nr:MATE family efflux transporter [Candidatus Vogelbacteria bacterium]
ARLGAIISFVVLSAVGLTIFIFASNLIAIFIPNDPSVIQAGSVFVRIIALTFGFMGLQMALTGVFRASGNMIVTMVLALISQWVFQFPIAYILSKHTSLGINGLWWAFPISNVLIALITMAWYVKGDWKNKKLTEEEKLVGQVSEEILVEEGVR